MYQHFSPLDSPEKLSPRSSADRPSAAERESAVKLPVFRLAVRCGSVGAAYFHETSLFS
jgi:hypothetical protein